ncbi:MAG: hypothetical protein QOI48_585 [Solirubrobacteraceae bacterium]|nr:hypothetical protein [Solirubrobacteraceae bacterium]
MLAAAVFALGGIGAGDWSLDNVLGVDLAGAGLALGAHGAGTLGGLAAILSGRLAAEREPGHDHPAH